jgi:hypothetical protein
VDKRIDCAKKSLVQRMTWINGLIVQFFGKNPQIALSTTDLGSKRIDCAKILEKSDFSEFFWKNRISQKQEFFSKASYKD